MIHLREFNPFEENNAKFLVKMQVSFATLQITPTGYKKSILDATVPVRAYLLANGIHDYNAQPKGQEHKKIVHSFLLTECEKRATQTSVYRPLTKDGDPRMWIYGLKEIVNPDDIFALVAYKEKLYIINLTQTSIERAFVSPLENPIKELITDIHRVEISVSEELLGLIKEHMSDWLPAELLADTGVGRTVETLLGIPMNDSKNPDYKGIELKSMRVGSNTRSALFTNAPDWSLSKCKSGREIVNKYGYFRPGLNHKTLQVTVSALKPNPQGLALNVNGIDKWLEMNYYDTLVLSNGTFKKIDDVAVWSLMYLHDRLAEKHHETFWIDVESRVRGNYEEFRVTKIEHTKNPILPQFDLLLEQGKIKVDLMLARPSGSGDTYSFKLPSKYRPLLFPEREFYVIN
ncbi:MAG: hypothetical protein IJT30_11465 [Muribaculaceae bacterium]|nr:hypothetical protein [Muribaculaceae bacterium]